MRPGTNTVITIADYDFFVSQQYVDFLRRFPEPAGLDFYLNILNGCVQSDVECIKFTRGAVAGVFFRSPEFQRKGSYVMYLYMVSLGQRAATVEELQSSTAKAQFNRPHYAEFMTDLGTISTPNDDPVLTEQKKNELAAAWMQRTEIKNIYDPLSNAAFVQKLLDTAGVTNPNQAQLVSDLNAATKTRAQVLRIIVESQQVDDKFHKNAFVTMEYFGFLRRDPESCFNHPNPSQCGYIFHNDRFKLVADPDFLENTIVRGFIESPEYINRF